MITIRNGSKGAEVMELQRLLNKHMGDIVHVDGVFGDKTLQAVMEFQREHALMADGIVGEKTWAALYGEPDITKAYIYTHITYAPNRPVKYIVIHYTAGSTSRRGAAASTRNVFMSRKASADFVVDDAEIVQINPDLRNYYCWSVGDKKNTISGGGQLYGKATNKNTISIEICSNLVKGTSAAYPNHGGWYYTEAALGNALRLVKYLMQRFGIPAENVVRHYDVSGKLCPGIFGWNDGKIYGNDGKATGERNNSEEWYKFKSRINND